MKNYNEADMLSIAIARYLVGSKNCFHGVASNIPMVGIMLSRKLYNKDLTYLNITGGVDIDNQIYEASTDGNNIYEGTKSSFNLTDIFDLAARGKLDVAFLSGGQVDVNGHVNNSVIGNFEKPKVRLPGGAGSAVLIPNCQRAFVWKSKHEKRGLVEKVDFTTSTGNVKYVFTPLCIFEYKEGILQLEARMPGVSVEEVKENTGFNVIGNFEKVLEEPTKEELDILNEIDPKRFRDLEI